MMDKIETPEEFAEELFTNGFGEKAVTLILNLGNGKNGGGWGKSVIQNKITSFAAAIRADERRKAADKFREAFCQNCEQYGLHDRVNDPCPELARLRAAIMAEPGEAKK